LSVQAANATNSASDRATINAEATQLVAEINRVATTTQFNGVNLLDGSFNSQSFQVGANSGQTITFTSIASATSASLGVGSGSSYSTTETVAATPASAAALTAGGISLNGVNVGATVSDGVSTVGADYSALAKANAINAVSGQSGVSAAVVATSVTNTATTTAGAWAFTLNGVALSGTGVATDTVNASDIAAKVNAVSNQTGVVATVSGNKYTLTAADGRNIDISAVTAGGSGATAATTIGAVKLTSTSSAGITLGGAQATAGIFGLDAGTTAATATAGAGVSTIDLTTAAGAEAAITTIDAALNQVNSSAGALGAYQNRFTSAVTNLQTTGQNLTAARSRIQDTDFAATTAQMTRGQILQQAGTAILAQANSQPNMVLSLLK
jgi:flagellin